MQYTYEITETDGNIICNIFRDNFLLIHQPHHPQQNVEQDGAFWKTREEAIAWAEGEVKFMNNPELFQAPVDDQPPAELPALTKEQEIDNIKDMLARIAGVHIEKIKIETDGE